MPVKWNTWRVIEAADKIDKHINAAAEPLECARDVAKEALQIPNLPQYITTRFVSLLSEIDAIIGDTASKSHGKLRSKVQSIRDDVPTDAIEGDKKASEYGETMSLI